MIVLRRSPMRRPTPPPSLARVRQWEGEAPRPIDRKAIIARIPGNDETFVVPIGKLRGYQSGPYMAAVRTLACARCGTIAIARQFCHRDEGKGFGIKTDCREGWPGCPPCHYEVGSSGKLGKLGRRAFELQAGADTRAKVLAAGKWPARLPRWQE